MYIRFVKIAVTQSRTSLNRFSVFYISSYSGLRLNPHVITDCDMADNSNLPANNTIFSDFGGTRHSGLGSNYGILTYF